VTDRVKLAILTRNIPWFSLECPGEFWYNILKWATARSYPILRYWPNMNLFPARWHILTTLLNDVIFDTRVGSFLTQEVEDPIFQADHSAQTVAEIKDPWSYAASPQYIFTTWCLIKHKLTNNVYILLTFLLNICFIICFIIYIYMFY
jgi:hypothetical protein